MRTLWVLVTAFGLSSAAQAAHIGFTAFLAAPATLGQTTLSAASPGYRMETGTEPRAVTRTLYRDEVRTTTRPVTETVLETVSETVLTPVATTAIREVKEVRYRPVYETVNETRTETILKPVTTTTFKTCTDTVYRKVTETVFRECNTSVCKPVTTTVMKPQCFHVCKQVCETICKDECRSVCKPVTTTVMTEVCRTICRPVTETVIKDVCRTEMRCVCEAGVKVVSRTICQPATDCGNGCNSGCQSSTAVPCGDKPCPPDCGCGKGKLCDNVCNRWHNFGACLGNCGAKLGAKIENCGPIARCLFIRLPDRVACRLAEPCNSDCGSTPNYGGATRPGDGAYHDHEESPRAGDGEGADVRDDLRQGKRPRDGTGDDDEACDGQ